MSDRAIGVFDSGLGGVSVLNKCIELMPNEDFIYFADKKNAPYGDKTTDEIVKLVENVIEEFFLPKNVKAIVIACNTATNAAIDILREKYNMPIIGTEPAIKPAINHCTENKKTIVIATDATIKSTRFKEKLKNYNSNKYIALGCSGLVELIEGNETEKVTTYFEDKLKTINIDEIESVVLGCTHYPFVKENIKTALKKEVKFFDGGEGVAKRLKYILESNNTRFNGKKIGKVEMCNSQNDEYNNKLKRYLGRK